MKKREQKLHLHRETLAKLGSQELMDVAGGGMSSCIPPNCPCELAPIAY